MHSDLWIVGTLLTSMILIVFTIVKLKIHPFLALLLSSFLVGGMMGMEPSAMISAIENGVGGTLGFLALVIGLGTILGKMMEISGAAERIGLTLQRLPYISTDVTMVLIGLICGVTLFVEVGVVLLIPLAFSIAKKTNTSMLKLAIPLGTALMTVHCIMPPHPAALFVTNALGADVGTVILYGFILGLPTALIAGPLFLKIVGKNLPFTTVPEGLSSEKKWNEKDLPSFKVTIFSILLPIVLMLLKTWSEMNLDEGTTIFNFFAFVGNPITAMFFAAINAYYMLGIKQGMNMSRLLRETETCFSSIANILLIIGAGGAFNGILNGSGLSDGLASILAGMNMHPILLAWLVALILHAAVGSATVAMMGATAIVSPMLALYPEVSPEILTLAIGSGAIGCTIVTDSLFWLVKQYSGASLKDTFKYYTVATAIASLVALGGTFLLSYII